MEISLDQIDWKLAVNILSDYIKQKDTDLIRIQQNFAIEFTNQKQADIHEWLIKTSKQTITQIQIIYEGTKSLYYDLNIQFAYKFFSKCFSVLEQTIKYLIQALIERLNRSIDFKSPPLTVQTIFSSVVGVMQPENQKCQQLDYQNMEQVEHAKRIISKDLQSIDYYLNSLAYEDSKVYEQYKSHCDKLLLQRQVLQNIKISNASKQIFETVNMIQNTMCSTQKLFQQSYKLKYMQFKQFISNIQEPEALTQLFKNSMENTTKQKFIDTIVKTVNRYLTNEKISQRRHRISLGVQTDDSKLKFQDKWQNLLIIQKKNNQKLTQEIQKLKRNSSGLSIQKSPQMQKRIEKEEIMRKQLQNKYAILQHLYNQKCYELTKLNSKAYKIFKTQVSQKAYSTTISTQTCFQSQKIKNIASSYCQTDTDFYYHYFQKNKIQDMQQKINELQKIVNYKQYIIQEMSAVKTFRDKFKSKKQICSVVLKPKKFTSTAKSLHYLHEEQEQAQYFDTKSSGKLRDSIQGNSTKKEVTFKHFKENGQISQKNLVLRKKSKKKIQEDRHKPYFTFNSKIQDQDSQKQFITSKKQTEQLHQISLKSILRVGSSIFKIDQQVQTDFFKKDQVIQSTALISNEARKTNSRDGIKERYNLNEAVKSKMRPSQVFSIKSQRQKSVPIQYNLIDLRKSNFVSTQYAQFKNNNILNVLPIVNRKSQNISHLLKRNIVDKSKYLLKNNKNNQNKIINQSVQVLHVNNLLNFNFGDSGVTTGGQPRQKTKEKDKLTPKIQINKKIKKMIIN